MPTLADDSGLEVAGLGGAPGVRSARYAGEPATDERNRKKLVADLASAVGAARAARFVCAVALAKPGVVVALAEGRCVGTVAEAPRGEAGFGYDSLFLLPDGRTMAERGGGEKDAIGHRGIALRRILPSIRQTLGIELRPPGGED